MIPQEKTYYNLLLKNYPRYDILRQELLKLFFRQALHEKGFVDCYINLNSYLSCLYDTNGYEYDVENSVVSSIVNFGAHLREFFASRFSMRCRVFFIYGNTRPDSAVQYIPEYDAHKFMDRETKMNITNIIDNELKTLSVICPYLPEIYYIENRTVEPAVIIRTIIKSQSLKGAKHARLIFSKDLYDYQLVTTAPNTHLIRVKKTMQGDMTYSVSFFDFYNKLTKSLGLKNPIGSDISPELYSLYMVLAGAKSRGVAGIVNNPRADNIIKECVSATRILNGYNISFGLDPNSFNPVMEAIKNIEDPNILFNRFCGVDLIHQCNLFTLNPSYNTIEQGIVNLYDVAGVKTMNNTMFKKYPLDLNVL